LVLRRIVPLIGSAVARVNQAIDDAGTALQRPDRQGCPWRGASRKDWPV
jgi:hypothetical protein